MLAVSGHQIPITIHYESRSNSRVSITRKGVILRICRYLSKADKSMQIEEFKSWAKKKLQQRPDLYIKSRKDYYSGKIISLHNRSYVINLRFNDTRTNTAGLNDSTLNINISTLLSEEQMQKTIARLISKCIAKEMYNWVHDKLCHLNGQHFPQKRFKVLKLKYTRSLWGSCSHEGNITISTRLLLAPDKVIDYVLVHELAHLIVPNHSTKFWNAVANAIPNYEASEKWLKDHGTLCDF